MNKLTSLAQIRQYRPQILPASVHQQLAARLSKFRVSRNGTNIEYVHEFHIQDYTRILEKMNRIGLVADEMDHHPEWTLKANCLKVELSTHEIGGKISIKDYILGYWIERILDTPALEDPLIKEWNTQNLNIKELL